MRNVTFSKLTDKINLSLVKRDYYAFKEFELIAHHNVTKHNVKKFKRLYIILLAATPKKL